MTIVIAEKPSVAKDLARIMGANQQGDGHIKGDNIAFTWAFGHLIQLAMPEAYGYTGFADISQLPMLPETFKIVPKQIKNGKNYIDDPGAKKQLNIIKNLFSNASKIIVATDAGREGELIFRYIYDYLKCTVPFERLWISSQTDEAVKKGFASLQPGTNYDNLYYAAKCRSEADWLIGLNATRALSAASQSNKTLSIGRVQTPTLAMICKRYIENSNFKVTDYFKIALSLEKFGSLFNVLGVDDFETQKQASEVKSKILLIKIAKVITFDILPKSDNPPKLHDLTSLQREASKKLDFTPDQTLEIAQGLYESKIITYPRTGSCYIGEDVFKTIPDLINHIGEIQGFNLLVMPLKNNLLYKGSVNDSKVTDHHALLPTNHKFNISSLKPDQKRLFDLIVYRFIEAFSPKCEKSVTSLNLEASGFRFRASATQIIHPGWRAVQNETIVKENDQENEVSSLPKLNVGDNIEIKSCDVLNKKTQPKPLLTMDTLLEQMENCGKKIEDEGQREAMKDLGLGTPATRASIITTLFNRDYVVMLKKKSIIPSALGLSVYSLIKDMPVGNPVLTGHWEQKLEEIRSGSFPAEGFMRAIQDYTRQVTKELLSLDAKQSQDLEKAVNSGKLTCPKCKKTYLRINEKVASCASAPELCGFKVFRTIAGKKITDLQLTSLLQKGETGLIKGFEGKSGKSFDAILSLNTEFIVQFKFPDVKRSR